MAKVEIQISKKHIIENNCKDKIGMSFYVLEKDRIKFEKRTINRKFDSIIE